MNRREALSATLGLGALALAGKLPACSPPKSLIAVSGPYTHANLTVFLLHGKEAVPNLQVLTLGEAMQQKKIVVHETGAVNALAVENTTGDADVFIQSGDVVKGGKQDRVLAFDMLVGPKSGKLPVPSFCVESGRWRQRGGEDTAAFAENRVQIGGKDLKCAINCARRQDQVWAKVKEAQEKLSRNLGKPVASPQSPTSYQLTTEDTELLARLDAYDKELAKVIDGKADVIGFVIAVNGKVEGADVYGSAALFRKLWPKLLKASATDALAEWKKDHKFEPAAEKDVRAFLAAAEKGKKTEVKPEAEAREQTRENRQAPAQPPAAPPKPPRVQVFQYDGEKIVMIECLDRERGGALLHRTYFVK